MKRRAFSQAAGAAALALANPAAHAAFEWLGRSSRPPSSSGPAMGTNLSGMEWARPGLRVSQSSLPNLHFTVPRAPNVAYLAACGYGKSRLPIRWEMLQPMLHDIPASPGAIAAIGRPGAFHAGYVSYIAQVLDAHAAAGIKCIIDCHNSCRYQDFIYQPDGTVTGLSTPANPLLRPYTSDKNQTITRIFALAPGATLTQGHFTDFWSRAAALWKSHPGFGGYGLMNEPHDMPRAGETVESTRDEDLSIWPAYAQAGIDAIRAVDPTGVIYVSGNQWNSSMSIGKANPGFPLKGQNLIYEVHMYLDAFSNGRVFDYDAEVAKNYSAGLGRRAINVDTGVERLKPAVEWARAMGVKLALTEVGMPIDDPRWEEMFRRAVQYAYASGMEIYSWMGGNHWPIRNFAINHVAGWHQNKTLEPAVSGVMKAVAGISQATLFDDGPGDAEAGQPVKITVYARGSLTAPLKLKVAASGGALSKSALVIPAGANGEDSFTFTPGKGGGSAVNTLTYSGASQVPPARKVYCLPDAPAYEATSLVDAAMAILAKYRASKWDLADGYTDYMLGAPARAGQPVRAVSDSGFGSSPGNAMEMLNWINTETSRMGSMSVPVMRESRGKKYSDHSRFETYGFWCKKSRREPGVQPRPANVVPYNLEDAHFALAVVSVPGVSNSGTVFQASTAERTVCSELRLADSQPQLRFIDTNGQAVELTSPKRLSAHTPSVLTLISAPGAQQLRVNSVSMASGNASFAPSEFAQLLMGWSFLSYYPRDGFRGHFYSAIAGKGAPTAAELAVLERYLAFLAGQSI